MLQSLAISLTYSLSGLGTFSRNYTLTCAREPVQRLLGGEVYEREEVDGGTGWISIFSLNTTELRLDGEGQLFLSLQLEESSPSGDISLSLEQNSASNLLDSQVFFFYGQPLTLYLQTTQAGLSGSIGQVSITPTFFTIDPVT
jgi:hypothetical protein